MQNLVLDDECSKTDLETIGCLQQASRALVFNAVCEFYDLLVHLIYIEIRMVMKAKILNLVCILGLTSGYTFGVSLPPELQEGSRVKQSFLEEVGMFFMSYQYCSGLASVSESGFGGRSLGDESSRAIKKAKELIFEYREMPEHLCTIAKRLNELGPDFFGFAQELNNKIAEAQCSAAIAYLESTLRNDIIEAEKGNTQLLNIHLALHYGGMLIDRGRSGEIIKKLDELFILDWLEWL